MLLDLLDSIDSIMAPPSSYEPSNVRLYAEKNKLFYEVILPGVDKSNIKLYKTSTGLEIKVKQPEYPTREYKIGRQPRDKTFSIKVFKDYQYKATSLNNGILTIELEKRTDSQSEATLIEW